MKFGTILADPPWKNRASTKKQEAFSAEHYFGMSVEDLCDLPVASVAANDAYLFLWSDSQHHHIAPAVAAAWGFRHYCTTITWLKTTNQGNPCAGIGRYSLIWSETLWLFKRGNPPLVESSLQNPFEAPRREHSRKPDEIYDHIESVHPKKKKDWRYPEPRLELFARTHSEGQKLWSPRSGWVQVGDEFDGPDGLGVDIRESLRKLLVTGNEPSGPCVV